MHEYSVALALIGRVEAAASAHEPGRVRRVHVSVGELSGVDAGLLLTAYDACRGGTICAGALLDVRNVATRWACRACGKDVPPIGPRRCPRCGDAARIVEGDELLLERIEMEVGDV